MFINKIGKPNAERDLKVGSMVISEDDGRCYLIVELDEDAHYNSTKTTYGLMNMETCSVIAHYDSILELKQEQIYSADIILYPHEYQLTLNR